MISLRGKNRSSVEECRLWNFLICSNPRKKFTNVPPEMQDNCYHVKDMWIRRQMVQFHVVQTKSAILKWYPNSTKPVYNETLFIRRKIEALSSFYTSNKTQVIWTDSQVNLMFAWGTIHLKKTDTILTHFLQTTKQNIFWFRNAELEITIASASFNLSLILFAQLSLQRIV